MVICGNPCGSMAHLQLLLYANHHYGYGFDVIYEGCEPSGEMPSIVVITALAAAEIGVKQARVGLSLR
jgi:hypothetical protein